MKKKTAKNQPNHIEKKDHYTPPEVAFEFWRKWYQETDNLRKEMIETSGMDACEKKQLLEYTKKIDSLGPLPVGNIEVQSLQFDYLQKASIDWHKIKSCLSDFIIDDRAIEALVFVMMPAPVNDVINTSRNPFVATISEEEDKIISRLNQQIKQLSPLVKRLENLQQGQLIYNNCEPLWTTIEIFKQDIAVNREVIKLKHNIDKAKMNFYGIDKDLKKSPQKHKFWNFVVSFAVKTLNPYCHDSSCYINSLGQLACKKTHEKAYTKVAELLKILYPSIWKEDVQTIANRIKQKDYRAIPV